MTITQIRSEPEEAAQLWQRFLAARAIAMRTLDLKDATIAGRAWRDFLAAFTTSPSIVPEQFAATKEQRAS